MILDLTLLVFNLEFLNLLRIGREVLKTQIVTPFSSLGVSLLNSHYCSTRQCI